MLGGGLTDFIIADRVIIPEQMQVHYSEKVAYIPCYQVNDSAKKISNKKFTRQDFGLPETKIVFCSFNNNYKITPQIFFGWMRILQRVEGSVLWLGGLAKESRENILNHANSKGISSNRIIFAERMELMEEHLARFRLADLFLDTFPYGAHTTASDALWAGLPVLTLAGETFASRVAASLLTALKLTQLITYSQDEYENLAVALGNDTSALETIRGQLDESKRSEDLFNSDVFVLNIEKLYKNLLSRT
jgi:predicted O-linked N-acetylglucosamine transferase (SPINDLY family)